MDVKHRTIATNGIELHAAVAGPDDGPTALLLHGFPDCWYGWHRQIEPLARAGYHVVVPDQRGYNLSDKPQGIAAYDIDELVRDVAGIIAGAEGRKRVCVAGHDWGAAVGWRLAETRPELLDRMVLVNAPHPAAMARHVRRSLGQLKKSWYILFFQLPWLPEWLATRNDAVFLQRALLDSSAPGTFSEADLAVYRAAWAQPGAVTAMIGWYRAAMRKVARPVPAGRRRRKPIEVPIRLIWGKGDPFLDSAMAQPSIERCPEGKLTFVEGAGHWVLHERPELVSELMIEWFAAGS